MITSHIPACPICSAENTYPDGDYFTCPDCAHEWPSIAISEETEIARVYKDAYGNILNNGDIVTLIKDLKVKGSSLVIKAGKKINIIRLIEGDHDIDCKVDGQNMLLKSEFMKKVWP